jgi:hypothetical protein
MNDNNLFNPDELMSMNRSNVHSRIFKIAGSVLAVGMIVVVGSSFVAHGFSKSTPDNSSTGYASNTSAYTSPNAKDDSPYSPEGTTATTPNNSSSPASSTSGSSSSIGSTTPNVVTPDFSAQNAAIAQEEAQAQQENAQAAQDAAQAQQDENAANNPQESPAEVAAAQCIAKAKADYQPEIDEMESTAPGGETYNLSSSGIAALKQLNNEYNNAIANCENS